MARYSVEFARFLLGLRGPYTSLTSDETNLLRSLVTNCCCVVEVGVHEGATSLEMARSMPADGRLYLVDPHIPATRMERWLGFSAARFVAIRSLRACEDKVGFVRQTSLAAAASLALHRPADLIFIDADHSYEAVGNDFRAWTPHLAVGGMMALHDSRLSPRRPDLGPDAGPVRFVNELLANEAGGWVLAHSADTLSVVRRK